MSTETKQEGVREHPDLEQEHIENLNDLVPDVVVEMFPGDVTQPDICNYDFNGKVRQVIYYDSGPIHTKWQHRPHVC